MRTLVTIATGSLLAGCSFEGSTSFDLGGSADPISDADAATQVDAAEAPIADATPSAPDAEVMHSFLSYWSFDIDATDLMAAHDGVLAGGAAITSGAQGFGGGEALVLSAGHRYRRQ